MLSARRYFQISLLFPILLPLLTLAIPRPRDPNAFVATHSALTGALGVAGLALLIAGIPYVLFAIALYFWIRHQSLPVIHVTAVLSPFMFCIPVWLFILCLGGVHDIGAAVFAFVFYSFWTLLVGYPYVLIVYAIYFVLRITGIIASNQTMQPTATAVGFREESIDDYIN